MGRKTKWTYEKCYEEAKKYTKMSEFNKYSRSCSELSRQRGWLKDFDWLDKRELHAPYTYEECYEIAKKYTNKHDFYRENRNIRHVVEKNGWIKDYTWFEELDEPVGNVYSVYLYHDEDTDTVYVGLTKNLERRHRQHLQPKVNDSVLQYFTSVNKSVPTPIILKDHLSQADGKHYEKYFIDYYKRLGSNVLNIFDGGSIGYASVWTYEKCYEEAKKYTSKRDFHKSQPSAYKHALQNGWVKDYTWFIPLKMPKFYWDYETTMNESKKYDTFYEFRITNQTAYDIARDNGWLKDYTWLRELTKEEKSKHTNRCYKTYEDGLKIASKYGSIKEFRENDYKGYMAVRQKYYYAQLKRELWGVG